MRAVLAAAGIALLAETHLTAALHGLDPAHDSKYQPVPAADGTQVWTCLDGSTTIPWSAVNDDYCDCPDGSDEPGTSACAEGTFYCANEGHIPGVVHSSRVNDGICDPECCDGSDEWDSWVSCPNRCEEVGKAYREKRAAETKIRRTGSKIRSSYISFAKAERTRLTAEVERLKGELAMKEGEVEAARVRLERYESSDKEVLERRQQSPLYLSLLKHRSALDRLKAQATKAQADLTTLKGIMHELSEGYNPNYQDMAVKAAVVGYQEAFLDAQPAEGEAIKVEDGQEDAGLQAELDELQRVDLTALAMSFDDSAPAGEDDAEGTLYRIDQYIPDALYEPYETVRDTLLTWLVRLGMLGRGARSPLTPSDAPHTADARTKFQAASDEAGRVREDLRKTDEALEQLDGIFGPQGEWKKLENTCIDKEQGGYTYTLCFFGSATQRSLKDSTSSHLGTFASWNAEGADRQSEAYYSKQLYDRGAKCWNGPERSVKVDITCGTTNELLSVAEPEKCEYLFKVQSPALCWPDASWEKTTAHSKPKQPAAVKEEL